MKNFNNYSKPFKKLNEIFNSLSEDKVKFTILGLGVERSYEDRSVYLNIKYLPKERKGLHKEETEIITWLNGEDAINLGQILIKHGLYSLESNMINHQKIHHYSQLYKFLNE